MQYYQLVGYWFAVPILTLDIGYLHESHFGNRNAQSGVSGEGSFALEVSESIIQEQPVFMDKMKVNLQEKLSPRKAKLELLRIIREMDANRDGVVTRDELVFRLQSVRDVYVVESVADMWKKQNPKNKVHITWEDIVLSSYQFMNSSRLSRSVMAHGQAQMDRDRARFDAADYNNDSFLSAEEYVYFVHPDLSNRTRHIITKESMDDMDLNHDGFVDLDEYVFDIWRRHADENEEEPDWVKEEINNFKAHRDINHDGKLDFNELNKMLVPDDHDAIQSEAVFLVNAADDNHDGKLSVDEIMSHSEYFVNNTSISFSKDEL